MRQNRDRRRRSSAALCNTARGLAFESCEPRRLLAIDFQFQQILTFPDETVVRTVRAADLDNDADLDLVILAGPRSSSSPQKPTVSWYRQDSDGAFEFASLLQEGNYISTGRNDAIEIGDIDMDGDLDLLTNLVGMVWWENTDGRGSFELGFLVRESSGQNPLLVDLDNDQDLDVATWQTIGRWGYSEAFWHENIDRLQLGVYGPGLTLEGSATATDGITLAAADFNADSKLDLLANALSIGGTCNYLGWFPGQDDPAAPFGRLQIIETDAAFSCASLANLVVVDFDGDEDPDVFGAENTHLWWHENVGGDEVFAPRKQLIEQRSIRQIHAADMDNDGDPDLVIRSVGSGSRLSDTVWLENLGDGTIGESHPITTATLTIHEVVDFDHDGDLDIIGSTDNRVVIYESTLISTPLTNADIDQNGTVDFADFLILAENFGRTEATAAHGDLNGDAKVDFADFLLLAHVFPCGVTVSPSVVR